MFEHFRIHKTSLETLDPNITNEELLKISDSIAEYIVNESFDYVTPYFGITDEVRRNLVVECALMIHAAFHYSDIKPTSLPTIKAVQLISTETFLSLTGNSSYLNIKFLMSGSYSGISRIFTRRQIEIIEDGFEKCVRYFRKEVLELLIIQVLKKKKPQSLISISSYLPNPIDFKLYDVLTKHPDILKSINWRVFEKLIADVLESFGYSVDLMQGTKDGGIDVIAFSNDSPLGKHKYLIQAKRWTNKVDVEPVRSLGFLHQHHKATKSCLVTTSEFTKGAYELAKSYDWQLELKDFDGFLEWLKAAKATKQA